MHTITMPLYVLRNLKTTFYSSFRNIDLINCVCCIIFYGADNMIKKIMLKTTHQNNISEHVN